MHSSMRRGSVRWRPSLIALALLVGLHANAAAQTQLQTDSLYIGTGMAPTLDPFIVSGLPAVSAGSGTINPTAIDSNGVVRKETSTSISTAGLWTFGARATFNANLRTTATAIGSGAVPISLLAIDTNGEILKDSGVGADTSGHWDFSQWLYSPFIVATGTALDVAQGLDNVRITMSAGTPRLILEDAGFSQWTYDNSGGTARFFRTNASGVADQVPFSMDGNINVAPYGKYILPVNPYEVSLGSIQRKFGALWVADLFAETLVATDAIGTTGNHWLIGSTNILDEDITSSSTTIITRYNNFAVNDHVYFMNRLRTEFMKIGGGPTLINKITNPDFETGVTPTWDVSASDTLAYTTTKTFHGDKALLLTHGGTSALQIAQQTGQFSPVAATAYTFCGYFRRVDGAAIAPGDVQMKVGNSASTYVDLTAEATGTDAWYRLCGTQTTPNPITDARAPFLNWTSNNSASTVDWYMDAFQLEPGSSVRPWSPTRSSYTISVRDEDGGGANPWAAGDAAFDTGGAAGYGWLDCYSLFGLKSTAEIGPSCVAIVRTGTAFNAWEPYAGWGNLNGNWGYGANTFGFVAGPNSGYHATFDNVNGIAFWSGANKISSWDLSTGTIRIGDFTTGHSSVRLTTTDLVFCANGILCPLTLKGATGEILGGSATAFGTGTGFYLAGGSSAFRVGIPGGNRFSFDGTDVVLGSNKFIVDASGPRIAINPAGTLGDQQYALSWMNSSYGGAQYIDGYDSGAGTRIQHIFNNTGSSFAADISVRAETGSSLCKVAAIDMLSNTSGGGKITLNSGCSNIEFQSFGSIYWGPEASSSGVINLGGASNKWKEIYATLTTVSGTPLFPLVDNSGRIQDKTDGANTGSCPGGQHVASWVIHFGIVISFTCS